MSRRLPLLLLLAMLLPAFAAANGKYVTAIVTGDDPAIPVQRAAIRYADGVQTLVVESTFVAEEAGEVAWILPLPAEPTAIEVVSPGLIETMGFQFGPGVHRPIRGRSMIIEGAVRRLTSVGYPTRLIPMKTLKRQPRNQDKKAEATVISQYDAAVDAKKRISLRGTTVKHFHVKALSDGRIVLEPRLLVPPEAVSPRAMKMLEKSVASFKKGRVSPPVDLPDLGEH